MSVLATHYAALSLGALLNSRIVTCEDPSPKKKRRVYCFLGSRELHSSVNGLLHFKLFSLA